MKAITSMSPEEVLHYNNVGKNLIEKLGRENLQEGRVFEEINRKSGYAHYTFTGKLSPIVAERIGRMPTPDEVIILVDSGFSHFGASCSLSPDGSFSGRISTD